MATLAKTSYPGDWNLHQGEDWKVYHERVNKLYESIPQDRIIQFPIADGYALYFVKSEKPLVLQHIPYMDAWQVPYVTIRGLRLADVKLMLKREANLRKIFNGRKMFD